MSINSFRYKTHVLLRILKFYDNRKYRSFECNVLPVPVGPSRWLFDKF